MFDPKENKSSNVWSFEVCAHNSVGKAKLEDLVSMGIACFSAKDDITWWGLLIFETELTAAEVNAVLGYNGDVPIDHGIHIWNMSEENSCTSSSIGEFDAQMMRDRDELKFDCEEQ